MANFPTNYMQEVIKVNEHEIKQHPHKEGCKSKYYGEKRLSSCSILISWIVYLLYFFYYSIMGF